MPIDNPINLTEKDSPVTKQDQESAPNIVMTPDIKENQEAQPEREQTVVEQHPESDIPKPASTPLSVPESVDNKHVEVPLSPEEEHEIEEIEDILEEDLGEIYNDLDPKTKEDFKRQGEQTTKLVFTLLHKARIRTHGIIKAIAKWLKIIPGLNRNFIEQESKIKTDKIVDMHEHEHNHDKK